MRTMKQIDKWNCRRMARLASVAGLLAAASFPAAAQDGLFAHRFEDGRSGIQLYDITGFSTWQSVASPQGSFFLPNSSQLKSDVAFGASASVGWRRHGEKSNAAIRYTSSYSGRYRYSEWNALNHFLSISASRHLSARWNADFSVTSAISSYDQMLFTPTLFGGVAAAPGSFDDLAAAVLAGKYSNDQLASLLTGAPMIESPSRTLFFGNRVFLSAATASLSYAMSPRLSFAWSATGGRIQHLADSVRDGGPQYPHLIPAATQAGATMSVSYAKSARTEIGMAVSSSRGFSRFQQAYTSSATGHISRTFGRHWFGQIHGGAGLVTNIRSQVPVKSSPRPIAGAMLGYRTYAHTFLVSYDRTLGNTFGIGTADMIMTTAAWNWWRPGRSWGLTSSYMQEQLRHTAFQNVDGWRATVGLARQMGRHMMFETAYSYGSFSGMMGPLSNEATQSSVRVSVMWSPQAGQNR